MTGRRSWHTHHVGHLHLTIEAEPSSGLQLRPQHDLHATIRELVDVLEDHHLAAAWAVADPAHSAVTSLVAVSEVPHELALLGDRPWLGPTAGRKRFAHELARRIAQARAKGIHLETLVPRVASVAEHIDLVVKHGVRAVVGVDDARRLGRMVTPRLLHYGVWEFAATDRLPDPSAWSLVSGWRLRRSLRRAAAEAASLHWLIDATALAQQGRSAVTMVTGILRQVAQLRDRGFLRVETLGAAAVRLSEVPTSAPQRSILRAAA